MSQSQQSFLKDKRKSQLSRPMSGARTQMLEPLSMHKRRPQPTSTNIVAKTQYEIAVGRILQEHDVSAHNKTF